MSRSLDVTGEVFGRLTAVRRTGSNSRGKTVWLFECSCGGKCESVLSNVRSGNTTSCGCLSSRLYSIHGMNGTRLFNIYRRMIDRCYNSKHKNYSRYGGRGITVCSDWLSNRSLFFDWAKAHGYDENLSIDRIDNDKGYFPDNCRWVTKRDQSNNRNNTLFVTIDGETKAATEWARQFGVNPSVFRSRLNRGSDPLEALTRNTKVTSEVSMCI